MGSSSRIEEGETPDIDKAKRFDTEEQAQSEAWHPLCFWKAIPEPEAKR